MDPHMLVARVSNPTGLSTSVSGSSLTIFKKVMVIPPKIPALAKGQVIVLKIRLLDAPKLFAPSYTRGCICAKAVLLAPVVWGRNRIE